ncbi:hypothetical protein C8R44DRAFT_865640 [Mycena epipterygia]|nr:hypothetical protein C8R44DRAFT_865640 [Mycena epipterygia]
MSTVVTPLQLGSSVISNKIGMNAMTRNRSTNTVPNELMKKILRPTRGEIVPSADTEAEEVKRRAREADLVCQKVALAEASAAVGQGGDVVLIVLGVELVAMAGGRESHATYYFIAVGCYVSLGNHDKAQELLDAVLNLRSRKMGGKDLPTKVLNRKKGWNTHQRIEDAVAEAHIKELAALTLHVALAVQTPFLPAVDEKQVVIAEASVDLDTPDERVPRLLLGIMHRTLRFTWIAGVALFELAVTDLKEADATDKGKNKVDKGQDKAEKKEAGLDKKEWVHVLVGEDANSDGVLGIAGKSDNDLPSRIDSRIALLWDEIATKHGMAGI